jgi:hypothetical protein
VAGGYRLVKVAGTCAGVQNVSGADGVVTQTLYINTSNLTIRGGYSTADWSVSDPTNNPPTLSAEEAGRVIFVPYSKHQEEYHSGWFDHYQRRCP